MFASAILRRTGSSAARAETLATSAASLSHRKISNPLQKIFESDRNYGDEIRPVYGRGWKCSESRLKSWDDLYNVFSKEKNLPTRQQQMLHAMNFRFPIPEHLLKGGGIHHKSYSAEKEKGDIDMSGKSRPLSPHLPVYKPQLNSVFSIYNRISGVVLTTVLAASYLLTTATDYLTLYPFYTLLFYSKHLVLITSEMTVLALAYHFLHGIPHIYHAIKDRILILADKPTRLGLRGLVVSEEATPKK